MVEKIERKIKFQMLNPVGEDIVEPIEIDYYNLGWKTPPEEYPEGQEPQMRPRYFLTIGEHQYFISRKGEILEEIPSKEKNSSKKETDNTLRNHYAGLAMQAIIQSEKHMDAAEALLVIANEPLELQDAISILAIAQAESMMKMIKRIDEEKETMTK